jgi:hypothetical protein
MNTEAAMLCADATNDCLETQASYVPRAYAEAMALGLEAQSYYALNATGWWNSGLLNPDLTPKPAYRAYQAAHSFLGTSQYLGEASGYPEGVEGYSFRRSRPPGQMDVLWSATGSMQEVNLPSGSSAYDHYGQLIASSGEIQVGRKPVYIARP